MAKEHIIMLPFMAKSHFTPFIALAELIEERTGYAITIANTPFNVKAIQSSLPKNSTIRLATIPFESTEHGLPPNCENTDLLHFHQVIHLYHACDTFQPHFETIIDDITRKEGRPPLGIVSDGFFGWTVDVAEKNGIFHTVFCVTGAFSTAVYTSLWTHLPHCNTDADEFDLPGFPNVKLHRSQLSGHLRNANGADDWSIFYRKQTEKFKKSNGVFCNAVEDMDQLGLQQLRSTRAEPIWAIGPIMQSSQITSGPFTEWLNLHPPSSTVYVSFGSMNSITMLQMMELAKGLELSGKPFIWVVRPPVEFDVKAEFRPEWLPERFEDRMKEKKQGLVVHTWAPQLEILSHPSTGVFLSHVGWNSLLESLSQGVPMIGWPLMSEQFYNCKMLVEELGAGVEIARARAEIRSETVEKAVRVILDGSEKGKEMKKKAMEVKEIINAARKEEGHHKGSSVRALDDFIGAALSKRYNTKQSAGA